MSSQCTHAAMNAKHILGSTNNRMYSRSSDYFYCPALKRCLEDCVQFCVFSIREICKLEQVQQWPTKMTRRLKHMNYEERLKDDVCSAWRRGGFRGPHYCLQLSKRGELSIRQSQTLLRHTQSMGKRQQSQLQQGKF